MNDKEAFADVQADLYVMYKVGSNFINTKLDSYGSFYILLSDSQNYRTLCLQGMVFEINFFEKFFGSRSGPTFVWS